MLALRWLRTKKIVHGSSFSLKANGIDLLRDPHKNKGTAFTIRERQLLGVHGLLPPAEISLESQVKKIMIQLKKMGDPLQRYIYLSALQERNEVLFYRLVIDHVEYIMPLIYTPNVGLACQRFGVIFRRPRGLYITIHDRHHIDRILDNWPEHTIKAIVFTDGERILGLGDLGSNGMGIPIGKLSLYTALAGVHPTHCLPVQLDVGTNNKDLLEDSNYMGLRHERIQDERYDELVDNFMKAIVNRYGMNTLIQFEDFANHNAFKLLHRYKDVYCTFNDDIQGTASVAVAGLLASTKLTGRPLSDNVFLFVGAGEAATGIASLLHKALMIDGNSAGESYKKIFMYDKDGLLVKSRPEGNLNDHNIEFAREDSEVMKDIAEIVRQKKVTAIIGASGCGGLFTQEVLMAIDKNSDRPIIFALSNPTSKAECTAEQAYKATQGRCVFTSGSPFGRIEIDIDGEKKVFQPGQCNNSYIFPGVGLAITACEIRPIPDEIFVIAANALADQVDEHDLKLGRVFPPLGEIRDVSLAIAEKCAVYAYENNIAHALPQPEIIQDYLKKKMYEPVYEESMPEPYDWPEH